MKKLDIKIVLIIKYSYKIQQTQKKSDLLKRLFLAVTDMKKLHHEMNIAFKNKLIF